MFNRRKVNAFFVAEYRRFFDFDSDPDFDMDDPTPHFLFIDMK
jgi:hypothetical protein